MKIREEDDFMIIKKSGLQHIGATARICANSKKGFAFYVDDKNIIEAKGEGICVAENWDGDFKKAVENVKLLLKNHKISKFKTDIKELENFKITNTKITKNRR